MPVGVAANANPNSVNYTQTPSSALSQPVSTSIAMTAVDVQFPSNTVHYNARTFSIPTPSAPTTYYVTIADSGYIGDNAAANLTATCQTSSALVGKLGNTFIGSIVAVPAGGSTSGEAGGWPPQQLFLINGS